jgi:selenocysteine-specific translation elongation factor
LGKDCIIYYILNHTTTIKQLIRKDYTIRWSPIRITTTRDNMARSKRAKKKSKGLRLISHKSNRGKSEKSRKKGSKRKKSTANGKYKGGKRDYKYEYKKYHASSKAKKARSKRRRDRKKITRKVTPGNVGNRMRLPEVHHVGGIS